MMPVKNVKAVLFDYDGVLVASEPFHLAAWIKLMSELGISFGEKEMKPFVGWTGPQILRHQLASHRSGSEKDENLIASLMDRKNSFYLSRALKEMTPYDGVTNGLKWLRSAGIKTAIVSNSRRPDLVKTTRTTGLDQYIDFIISRDEVSIPKPDPAMYLSAAKGLGCKPGECIAVEDSPPGLLGALRAGIASAALLNNFSIEQMSRPDPARPGVRPDWTFACIADFFAFLKLARSGPG
ncbi:MAG: hypothetical protein A2583_12355 [Bdellovibrionales bacterium RIFOXYD1_FULL_53_11]|nr:MAG: hypothetical protein A2583_12355 [Bdellovibrionales bacterium RIFOXYD1_FULL_53_11]